MVSVRQRQEAWPYRSPRHGGRAERPVRNLRPVAPSLLCCIERLVGPGQQLGGRFIVLPLGHTCRERGPGNGIACRHRTIAKFQAPRLGESAPLGRRRADQQDDKLVTSIPAGNVRLSGSGSEDAADLDEKTVAEGMPEPVVG